MKLVDVLYVPTLPVNLISASLLKKQGIYFSTLDNTLRLVKNHQEIGSAQDSMGLNMLQLGKHQALDAVACPTVAQVKPDVVLWHQRLSHAGLSQLKMTQNHSTGMEQVSFMESLVCEPCHLAKSQRTVSRKESERSTQPFGRIHLDVVGHLTPELACGDKWVVIITDDLTQYRWSRVTRTKGTAYEVIEWFVNLIKVQHPPLRVLEMVLDRGLEFGGRQLDALARKESIVVRKSSDYTPEQNGTAESSNKVIMVRARSIVLDSGLPGELWRGDLQAIGSLLFLANRTRPDMEYAVNFLARFSHNPSIQHWNAVKRVFRYLAGTVDLGIRFQTRAEEPFLFGYSDADFAGDIDERKSTSGYLFIFGGGPISWKSQRQRTVTLSTTEAEYAALTEAVRESNSIRQLLTELGIAVSQPIPILEDNLSTISLANNHANHKRSKHVDIRNHYCREQATTGNIAIRYISTDKQAADSLTKPLGPQKWKAVLEQLRLSGSIATSAGSEGVC